MICRRLACLVAMHSWLVFGCFGADHASDETKDDLDVSPTKSEPNALGAANAHDTKDATGSKEVNSAGGGVQLSKAAVTNWQAFFKAPPSQRERDLLEQRLTRWQETSTPVDLLAKGRVELALGKITAAEASFRQALRLDGDNLDVQLELATLYLRRRALNDAFQFLAQIKEIIATSDKISQSVIFRYRYTLALAHIARGDRPKGHKILSDLIGSDNDFSPAYVALAASYIEMGRDGVAEFVIRRGLDRVKESAPLFNLLGVIAQRGHQNDAARAWFDKAIAASPSFVPALVNRANVAMASLEYAAAEEDLQSALVQDPQSVDALVALGIVQRRRGNIPGARSALTKAVDLDPDHAYARFNLGVVLADDLKKPNEAMRLFHEVMQTAPANSELRELARSYINDLHGSGMPF